MASKTGLTWTSDTLTGNLSHAQDKAVQYLAKTTEYYSLRSETYAKSKAKWTDRTGNARSGLTAQYSINVGATNSVFQIDVFHRVSYGIWLEVRWNGKYGIINRTTAYEGPKFFAMANRVMAKMFGGS